uniref:BHLH domain-containing protein n=1 Tax=Mola mola TaxID=94237 RepID=A0A3Q3XHI9_MOLML
MNRSLERLRNMLLQETQLGGTQRRVEKAEILEHTVLFLQNIAKGDSVRAVGGDGNRNPSFQDGISTCLQRAARFLGPEGKGLWVGAPLDASFTARVAPSDSESARAPRRPEGSLQPQRQHHRASKQSLSQILPILHTLWRPWP